MDFHRIRTLASGSMYNLYEGIFTLKNYSLPHVLLALTGFLFQSPNTSPTFYFTSLPILIHLAATSTVPEYVAKAIVPLISATTGSSLFTSWNLVSSAAQVIAGQTALSACVGLMAGMAVLVHRLAIRFGGLEEGSWDTTLVFGLIWAAAWLVFTWASPFGRFSIPSPLPADITLLAPVHRYLGTTGVDALLGSAAYVVYHTGQYMRQELPAIDAPTTPHTPPPKDSAHISVMGSTRTSCSSDSDSTLHSTPFVTPFGSSSDRSTAPASASPGSRRRYSPKASIAALAALGGVLSSLPEAVLQTTSDSLDTQTPFGLGFVLPPGKGSWRLYELVHEAQTIGNRANLLVFPESAYQAYDKWDRQYAIDKFVSEVCRQYGVWVQLGIDTPSDEYHIEELSLGGANSTYTTVQAGKKINEVVLLGPEGYTGSYVKQTLIPYVESFPFHRGIMPVPTWTISLPPPPGINKTDWTLGPPYVRPIVVSPLICLDTFHPDLLASPEQPPDLFTVSAAALTHKIARHIVGQAESLALTQNAPVMVVAGSRGRMGEGISALLDSWGRVLMEQRGGRSIIYQVALSYSRDGKPPGGAWVSGSTGLACAFITILGFTITKKQTSRHARTSDSFPMKILTRIKSKLFSSASSTTDTDLADTAAYDPQPTSQSPSPPWRTDHLPWNGGQGGRRSDSSRGWRQSGADSQRGAGISLV